MKRKLLLAAALPLILTACGGSNDFFNKTFEYRGGSWYDLECPTEIGAKSFRTVLEEQISKNNINWEASGAFTEVLGIVTSIVPFEKHANYGEVISSMESMSKTAFDNAYKGGLKIEVGSLENKDCKITLGNEVKNYKLKTYGSNPEDATYQQIMDGDNVVGNLNIPSWPNFQVRNGSFPCIELTYKGVTSRTNFMASFIEKVEGYTGLQWTVWAKISN